MHEYTLRGTLQKVDGISQLMFGRGPPPFHKLHCKKSSNFFPLRGQFNL